MGGEYVGLLPTKEEHFYEVYYGPVLLGWFDETENYFAADAGAPPKRNRQGKPQRGES
jgi:hypothetical protein